jgi:hypothetical protein
MRGAEFQLQLLQQLHGVRRVAFMADDERRPVAELGQAREQRPHRRDAGMLDSRPIAHQGAAHRSGERFERGIDARQSFERPVAAQINPPALAVPLQRQRIHRYMLRECTRIRCCRF